MGFILRLFVGGSSLPWIIGGIMLLLASGFTWLKIHDYNVWEEATTAFNQAQEQLTQKKQEEFQQQTNTINENANKIREQAAKRELQLLENNAAIEKQAYTEVKSDIPSSPYLKSIVKQLQSTYGVKK